MQDYVTTLVLLWAAGEVTGIIFAMDAIVNGKYDCERYVRVCW